jgi:hypothetical protein
MSMGKENKPRKHFTGSLSTSLIGVSLALGGILSLLFILLPLTTPKVEAQFAGQTTFSQTFTVGLPGTVGTHEHVSIPNRGQLSETISYTWNAPCATTGNTATFYLEGSNDNANWFALATSVELFATASSAVMYSNGYFTYKRLSFPPCENLTGPATFTGVYTGYGYPLPLNFLAPTILVIAAQAFAPLGPAGFNLVNGFQCSNPNASTAFLFLGNVMVPLPATSTYSYGGPGFLINRGTSNYGAYTTAGHTVPVATPVDCTIDITGGPFYPLSPPVTD